MKGDINEDSVVNQEDVDLLWDWVSFPNKRDGMNINLENADVNASGDVNIGDAVLLANRVAHPYNEEYLLADETPTVDENPQGSIIEVIMPSDDVFVDENYNVHVRFENTGEITEQFRVLIDENTGNWTYLQPGEGATATLRFMAESVYGASRVHHVRLESEGAGVVDQIHSSIQYFKEQIKVYKDVCIGHNLYTEEYLNGQLVTQKIIEYDSERCGYMPKPIVEPDIVKPDPEPAPKPAIESDTEVSNNMIYILIGIAALAFIALTKYA